MNPLRPRHIRTAAPRLKERGLLYMKMKMTDFLLLSLLLLALFGLDSVDRAGPIIDTDR